MSNPNTSAGSDIENSYLAVLFGVGFAISFDQIRTEPWFLAPSLILTSDYITQFLSLILVYVTVALSALGVHKSVKKHRITSDRRFLCTVVILIFYFPFFLKFMDFGSELVLLAVTFFLFSVWDILKEKEYELDMTMRPRTWVTIFWTLFFTISSVAYFFVADSQVWTITFIMLSYWAIISYRFHKETPYPFSRLTHPWFSRTKMTEQGKERELRIVIRFGILSYLVILGFFAFYANLDGSSQANISNTFATISGVLLGLYAIVRKPLLPKVVLFLLISILVALTSSIVSYDRSSFLTQIPFFSKSIFMFSLLIFAYSTYLFGGSVALSNRSSELEDSEDEKIC